MSIRIKIDDLREPEPSLWKEKIFASLPVSYRAATITLLALLLAVIMAFCALVTLANRSNDEALAASDEIAESTLPVSDRPAPNRPYKVIDEECYLDRYREFHMFCQVVPDDSYTGPLGAADAPDADGDGVVDVGEVKVDYVLYGYGVDEPFSHFSTWTDENGYINVVVDFSELANDIDDEHVIGSVDGLASYGIAAVEDQPLAHSIKKHEGEPAHARDNWVYSDTWYHMDFRSYGTLDSAARNSGWSPDPAVRERFSWHTAPQMVANDANANGTCNYWGDRNWIIVHDYSWIGQMWLTMCPGMTCWVDGVEYRVGGVFDIRKVHTDWDVWDIVGDDTLILQTCDGWIYNRLVWVVPVDEQPDPEAVRKSEEQADNYTW